MLICKNHRLPTVHAGDIDQLCGSDGITTARADVLPAVGLGGAFDDSLIIISSQTGDSEEEKFVAGDMDAV